MLVTKTDPFLDNPDFDWIWAVKMRRGHKCYGIRRGVKDCLGADAAEVFWDTACDSLRKYADLVAK